MALPSRKRVGLPSSSYESECSLQISALCDRQPRCTLNSLDLLADVSWKRQRVNICDTENGSSSIVVNDVRTEREVESEVEAGNSIRGFISAGSPSQAIPTCSSQMSIDAVMYLESERSCSEQNRPQQEELSSCGQ